MSDCNPSHSFFFSSLTPPVSLAIPSSCAYILSYSGYQGPDFDWADYLKQCEAEAAPQPCFPTVSVIYTVIGNVVPGIHYKILARLSHVCVCCVEAVYVVTLHLQTAVQTTKLQL